MPALPVYICLDFQASYNFVRRKTSTSVYISDFHSHDNSAEILVECLWERKPTLFAQGGWKALKG